MSYQEILKVEKEELASLKKQGSLIFCAVIAQSLNGVIGKDGRLPWHEPADLKQFMSLTMGGCLVMGRRTWEGFGGRPLTGRQSIVLSRNKELSLAQGVSRASNIQEAITIAANKISREKTEKRIFIIGGSTLYSDYFELLDEIWLSLIKDIYDGDVHFNAFTLMKGNEWEIVERKILSDKIDFFDIKRK